MNEQELQEQPQEKDLAEKVMQSEQDKLKNVIKDGARKTGQAIGSAVVTAMTAFVAKFGIWIAVIGAVVGLLTSTTSYVAKDNIVNIGTVATDKAFELMEIGDNGPLAPSKNETIAFLDEELKKIGIHDKLDLQLGTDEQASEYLYKYLLSSLSTQLPYIEGSTASTVKDIYAGNTTSNPDEKVAVQGIVKVKRTSGDTTKNLTFKKHSEFEQLINDDIANGTQNARDYFSIDENWNLCVAKYSKTTTTSEVTVKEGDTQTTTTQNPTVTVTVSPVKIPYKSMISQYSVPFEFLLALQQVSLNSEYVSAVADLISEQGEIELTIFDSGETRTTEYTYQYDEITKWVEEQKVEIPSDTEEDNNDNAGGSGQTTDTNNSESSGNSKNNSGGVIVKPGTGGVIVKPGTGGTVVKPGTGSSRPELDSKPTTRSQTNSRKIYIALQEQIGDTQAHVIPEEVEEESTQTIKVTKTKTQTITEKTTTVVETNSVTANVTKANVWVLEQSAAYNHDGTTEYPLGENPEARVVDNEEEPPEEEATWRINQNETTKETLEKSNWTVGTPNTDINPIKFLGLLKNSTGTYEVGTDFVSDGKNVKYNLPTSDIKESPIGNIFSSLDMLYKLLDKEATQSHAQLMKAAIHYYNTGEKLAVDLSIYAPKEFTVNNSFSTGLGSVHETKYTLEEFVEIVNNFVPPNGSEEGYNKYFKSYATDFYNIAKSYGLNPEFIFAIGVHESGHGTSRIIKDKNNAFGYGAVDGSAYESAWTFTSMKEGIEQECFDLSTKFLNPTHWKYEAIVSNGYDPNSIDGIGSLYASDGSWAKKVKYHMNNIFGYLSGDGIVTGEAGEKINAVIELAKSKQGCPYVWGDEGPNTFDCSGFTQWVFKNSIGIQLPRTSTQQANSLASNEVSLSNARPGDILWRSGHIAIYIGDNKYIHAPHTGDVVKISNNALSSFTKAFRVIND